MNDLTLSFGGYWVVASAILAVVFISLTYLFYRITNPPVAKAVRITLGAIRALAICLLLFALANPLLAFVLVRELPPHVVVLFDNSESMLTVEDFEKKREVMQHFADNPLPGESGSNVVRHDYEFSDTLTPVGKSLLFEAKSTALGDCLESVRDRYAEDNLQSIIVFSDGLVNRGKDPVTAARELDVPIYAVNMGPQKSSSDIRIVDVIHDDVAYVDKPVEVVVEIESAGYESTTVPLTVRYGSKVLTREDVALVGERARQNIRVEFVPNEVGVSNFVASIPAQPEEELTDNNRRTFTIKTLKSKQKILIAAGYPGWELTFLRRTLAKSADYDCDVSIFDPSGRLRTQPFGTGEESLSQYDLIVLVDYPPSLLASKVSELADYVEKSGGAIFFLLGDEFATTRPAGKLLELMPFDFEGGISVRRGGEFHMKLTEQGKLHPVTGVVEDAAGGLQAVWDDLPPFQQCLNVGKAKSGVTVLGVHPEPDRSGNQTPLLAVDRVGTGKILTVNFAPLWRIDFALQGSGDNTNVYSNFVNNCVRWLVTRDDVERVKVMPDMHVFRSGEQVTFTGTILDESYQAVDDGSITLKVYSDSADSQDTLVSSMVMIAPGKFKSDLHQLKAGEYSYSADVVRGDKEEASLSGSFTVESFSLEEETLYENAGTLEQISRITGGLAMDISNTDSLAAAFRSDFKQKRTSREFPLSNHWGILLMVLALFSTEWFVRKRLELL